MFTDFLQAYEQQLNSAEHMEAQIKSEERERMHVRLSQQIFQIRRKLKQGTCLQKLLDEKKTSYEAMSKEEHAMVDLYAAGHWSDEEKRFVSSLEVQIRELQQQQEPRGQKYISAGSASAIQMEGNESGNTYTPEPKSFNLLGRGKTKKGKGKGKSKK